MEAVLVEKSGLEQEWQSLLETNPSHARFQNSLEWKTAVAKAYPSLTPAYYILRQGGAAKLGLPAFYSKSLFGKRLVSLPFCDYGGFVGSPSQPEAAFLLDAIRKKFSGKLEVRLCQQQPSFAKSCAALEEYGLHAHSHRHVAFVELLQEKQMWEGLDKHARNDVRKAEKSGLELKVEAKGASTIELDAFYSLYLREMKRFGSPQHSKKFFALLSQQLGPKGKFLLLNAYSPQGEIAGSLIGLSSPTCGAVAFNVSEPSLRSLRPNDLLYWTALQKFSAQGLPLADLGQVQVDAPQGSHAAGILAFKLKWGGKPYARQVFTQQPCGKSGAPSATGASKLRSLSRVWSKLPDSLVEKLGPWVLARVLA